MKRAGAAGSTEDYSFEVHAAQLVGSIQRVIAEWVAKPDMCARSDDGKWAQHYEVVSAATRGRGL